MRAQRGTTLIEMLIASTLAVTVGCGLWMGWTAGYSTWDTVRAENAAAMNGRTGADRMADELRGASAVTAASATSLTVTNGAGQSVAYSLSGDELVRSVGGSGATVARGVTELTLVYTMSDGSTTSAPGNLSLVRAVRIGVAACGGQGSRPMSTLVRIRNL